MAEVRLCFVLVLFVFLGSIAGKPLFFSDRMFCDLFCEDDDRSTTSTTTSSSEDYDWWDCSDCPPRRRTTTPAPGMTSGGMMGVPLQPLNVMIPPGQPMNVTLQNQGGSWLLNFLSGAPVAPAPTSAPADATTGAPVPALGPEAAPSAPVPAVAPAPDAGAGTTVAPLTTPAP